MIRVDCCKNSGWLDTPLSDVVSWQGHIPFLFSLIGQHKPSLIVELGTHKGDSYFACCEAVQHHHTGSQCFAVDTWKGDQHSGHYEDAVFERVQSLNESYGEFSQLLRMTFSEALEKFEDGTIDLLHIDGLHTYEAVKYDFTTWQPKLSHRAIVLLHDTAVKTTDFGVWRFWKEISSQFPGFEFTHSNGLGVLFFGKEIHHELLALGQLNKNEEENIRHHFEIAGRAVMSIGLEKLLESRDFFIAEEIKRIETKADELHQQNQALLNQISNYQELSGSLENDKGALVSQINELLVQVKSYQELSGRLENDKDALVSQINELLIQVKSYQELSGRLENDKDALVSQVNELLVQLEDFIDEKSELSKQVSLLTEECATSEKRVKEASDQLTDISQQLVLNKETSKQLFCDNEVLQKQVGDYNQALAAVFNSRSWKVTAPFRKFTGAMRFCMTIFKRLLLSIGTTAFHVLPVSLYRKQQLRSFLYRNIPSFFNQTLSYKIWRPLQDYSIQVECNQTAKATSIEVDKQVSEVHKSCYDISLAFSHCEHPEVSIIIPVYGQLNYTLACLNSIARASCQVSYEIIIVDDHSTDGSFKQLRKIDGIQLIENSENIGFIRSCNKGARYARGTYIYLLNNDVEVHDGWLDALVQTFIDIPDAGLVGSRLVYPDGRLQEAGGIIWEDGSGWNFGRLQDPNLPVYNYLRDVDYCSGASIMLPADLWNGLEGFDEWFAPAYGEDSDLAFRVRQAGFRVLYQPASIVTHYEGVSSGTDTSSGVKAYQIENAKKIFRRWQDVLKDHGQPGVEPNLVKDRNIKQRILVLDHCTPMPDHDAGSITAQKIMGVFQALSFKVTFIPEDNFLFMEKYTTDLQRIGIECLYAPYEVSVENHLKNFGKHYDVVLMFRIGVATKYHAMVQKYCPQAAQIFHTSDLHFLRESRQAELENSESLRKQAELTKERELKVASKVDAVIVHSLEEKKVLEKEGLGNIHVFPWVLDVVGAQMPFAGRSGAVFVGGFQHRPNVDAVIYFAEKVLPIIRRESSDFVLHVVGSNAPDEIKMLHGNGINVMGFVENLQPLFEHCRLSVAPLRYGAGIKGKIGFSMSHGLPCVTTTIGAEGMALTHEENILIADTPEKFAAEVLRLHNSEALWNILSANSISYVQEMYSFERGKHIVSELLSSVNKGVLPISTHKNHASGRQLITHRCVSLEGFRGFERSDRVASWREIEYAITQAHQEDHYTIPGYCLVCSLPVDFLVDRLSGAVDNGKLWTPNWRERLVCPCCGMNNRQRAVAAILSSLIKAHNSPDPFRLYMTEQVTHIYIWATRTFNKIEVIGSEYLGEGIAGGTVINKVRHEDVEQLSFLDNSFDAIISNDVLEHVNKPYLAMQEMLRVLKPNGKLLMTIPFYSDKQESVTRAEIIDSKLIHHLPAVYHGNPVSEDGSLVFTDFGWQVIDQLREAGFSDASLQVYWSREYGHLGGGLNYFEGIK